MYHKKSCKKGEIYREGYTRISKKTQKKTNVKGSCIKDRGLPGKWSDKHSDKGIGKLKKGELTKYGYENVNRLSTRKRRNILKKCVQEYGALSVFRKLNAVYVYNRNTNPVISDIFRKDRDWVKKTFFKSKK